MKPLVVVRGSFTKCTYCKAFADAVSEAELRAALPGADVVYADEVLSPALFKKYAGKVSGNWPVVGVYDASGKFVAKTTIRKTAAAPLTPTLIVSKIQALCPDCCITSCGDQPAADYCGCGAVIKYCPCCGKELKP